MGKPKIRFKGYTEDWEQRKLRDICSRVQGNDGRMELPTLTISAGNGWMKQEDRFSGNIAGKEQKNYTLLKKGELSYNHGNSKLAKYGTVFSLQTYEEALVPRVYHSFKVEKGNASFIEYYFATKLLDRELGKLISSGARMDGLLNIGYDDFMGISLLLPRTQEQSYIAGYFRSLDHLITLHQRKCEETKKLKKYMLQKMFPQNGQLVPKIRFAGFTEDWEQRKLGDLVKDGILEAPLDGNHGEKHPTSDEYVESGIPFLMASDIHNGTVNISSCKYITKERAKKLDKGFARNGDVLLTHKATIGETAILGNLTTEYAMLTPQVTYYRIKNEKRLNREYLYSFFNSLDFQTELKTKAAQSTRPYIGITAQQNLRIILPRKIDEQRKLGFYFRTLDNLITLHQRKCDELQNMKKYMLQNMFN